jgi:hypothetical protein
MFLFLDVLTGGRRKHVQTRGRGIQEKELQEGYVRAQQPKILHLIVNVMDRAPASTTTENTDPI